MGVQQGVLGSGQGALMDMWKRAGSEQARPDQGCLRKGLCRATIVLKNRLAMSMQPEWRAWALCSQEPLTVASKGVWEHWQTTCHEQEQQKHWRQECVPGTSSQNGVLMTKLSFALVFFAQCSEGVCYTASSPYSASLSFYRHTYKYLRYPRHHCTSNVYLMGSSH